MRRLQGLRILGNSLWWSAVVSGDRTGEGIVLMIFIGTVFISFSRSTLFMVHQY